MHVYKSIEKFSPTVYSTDFCPPPPPNERLAGFPLSLFGGASTMLLLAHLLPEVVCLLSLQPLHCSMTPLWAQRASVVRAKGSSLNPSWLSNLTIFYWYFSNVFNDQKSRKEDSESERPRENVTKMMSSLTRSLQRAGARWAMLLLIISALDVFFLCENLIKDTLSYKLYFEINFLNAVIVKPSTLVARFEHIHIL